MFHESCLTTPCAGLTLRGNVGMLLVSISLYKIHVVT